VLILSILIHYSNAIIAELAVNEKRFVLIRSAKLLKQVKIDMGFRLESQYSLEQLNEVINHFQLKINLPL
jgi:uncharacterized protein with PIN domain